MSVLFVAGAGTDVGKTHVTAGLVEALVARGAPVAALKPLVSGFDPEDWAESDSGRLLSALGRPLSRAELDALSPWRYRAALSPDMAALREGEAVDFEALVAFCRRRMAARAAGPLLIEGVGGAMSPVSADTTNLDWMRALGAPVVLVSGSYLGAISHALTAAAVIRQSGLDLMAIIVSESAAAGAPLAETVASLRRLSGARLFSLERDQPSAQWAGPIIQGLNLIDA